MLLGAERYRDAGRLLLQSTGVSVAGVGKLSGEGRRRANQAATCFAKAKDYELAVALYTALGDPLRAQSLEAEAAEHGTGVRRVAAPTTGNSELETLIAHKDYATAAKLAFKLGEHEEAGRLNLRAGKPYEAAICFHRAGNRTATLEALTRVGRDHAKYRNACVQAIQLASDLNRLDFALDQFLGRFVQVKPSDEREAAAFYRLSQLYRSQDFGENATEVLQKLLLFDPAYPGAAADLAALSEEAKGSAMVFKKIVRDDAAFRGAGWRTRAADLGLPDLPPLEPSEPRMGPRGTRIDSALNGSPSAPASGPSGTRLGPGAQRPTRAAHGSDTDVPTNPAVHQSTQADGAPAVAMALDALAPGSVISERYLIQREVGRGGMAAVYEAVDLELEETVALKFFFLASDGELVKRFKQELALSRRLSHPNIVQVFDIGSHAGCKFISMELLHGKSLGDLAQEGSVPRGRLLNYLSQACAGLAAAHAQGVVHRDVKPDNFFVTHDDILKVMDFGIAKRQSKPGMTRAGFMAGTPEYMSPDQITRFGSVDARADIYSLGVVAYELLCGEVPFSGSELMEILNQHLSSKPTPPRAFDPTLTVELNDAVLRCLEKQPDDRFQSMAELGAVFDAEAARAGD